MNTDKIWEAEFRGLVWGDGYLLTSPFTRNGAKLIRIHFRLQLRADDLAVLEECQKKLGGKIYGEYNTSPNRAKWPSKPTKIWVVSNRDELKNIARILSEGVLPAKKAKEVPLWSEAIHLLHGRGHKYNDVERARLHAIDKELKQLRVFFQDE